MVNSLWRLGRAALLLALFLFPSLALSQSGTAAAGLDGSVNLCLNDDGKPGATCLPVRDLTLTMPERGSERTEMSFRIAASQVEDLRRVAAASGNNGRLDLCLVGDESLCLSEPLEFLETSVSAGRAAGIDVGVTLTAPERVEQGCRCLWKCAGASFFVNKTLDPLTSESIAFSDEHCEVHAQFLCQLRGKNADNPVCVPL